MARATVMALALLLAGAGTCEGAGAEPEVEQSLQRVSDFMGAINQELYRPAFELDALLDELAYDEVAIFEFVRDHVAYQVYPGIMRGAQGTLLSRAGNAADQSVLLARLMRDSGYDARMARARLSEDQALLVLQALRQPVSEAPAMGNAAAMVEVLNQWRGSDDPLSDEQIQAYRDYIQAPYRVGVQGDQQAAELETISARIRGTLDAAGAAFDVSSLNQALVEDARDYFWVQVRPSPSADWQDLHPVFQGEAPLSALEATQHIADEIPDDLLHKLRFQVFIEKTQGQAIEALPITAAWERPVANLVGVPLTFTNVPDAMLQSGALGQNMEELLQKARSFVPGFGSEMAPGGRFFDYRASLIDPMAAASPAAGLFATLGDSLAGATLDIDPNAALPMLTGQWVEFTLVSPNGEEQVFRRMTMDRIGADARARGEPPADLEPTDSDDVRTLMRRHTFMVQVGEIARGYVVDAAYRQYQASRPGIEATVALVKGEEPNEDAMAGLPPGWPGHLGLFTVFDAAGGIGDQHRNFRSGPALVIHSEGLGGPDEWVESIDIVSNPRRAVSLAGDVPVIDPWVALQSGIWETRVEGVLLEGDSQLSTDKVFEQARDAGIDTIAVTDRATLAQVGYSADIQAAMAREIDRGYYLVTPSRPPAQDLVAWWRVDPASGETLGQIADGQGGEMAQYVIGLTFSLGAYAYGMYGCTQTSSVGAATCCAVANTGLALFTFGIGTQLKGAMGVIAGMVLDTNRMLIPIPDVCDSAFSD
ncbi:hypothetical protein F3N42_00375 [Marinihelvus fidelis]|uniref:Transglutaminase-like domain-containing protein n=1 Tax=Marinihelvus fidelis TaxID=2613842 RepID=A0A5N0THH5_9GAMM|nr:transglutaminase domain-containing protein [Marinihelvus fidelis]KAA9134041.1 hypothetical protein F3N42_00375 [Marinihelvus fidelis]